MSRTVFTLAAVAALVFVLAPAVQAALYVYEPFDYPDGADIEGKEAQGLAPWSAGGGAGVIKAPGKTYFDDNSTSLIASGNYLKCTSGISVKIDTSLWPAGHKTGDCLGAPGATIWMSYIHKSSHAGDGIYEDISIPNENGGDGLLLGQYYWGNELSAIHAFPPEDATTDEADMEHFILVRHQTDDAGDTVVDMWVDPPLTDEFGLPDLNDPSPGVDHESTTDPYYGGHTFDTLRFRISNADFVEYDEIRMGTSYIDVTGLPEPATLILVSLGAAGTLLGRKGR